MEVFDARDVSKQDMARRFVEVLDSYFVISGFGRQARWDGMSSCEVSDSSRQLYCKTYVTVCRTGGVFSATAMPEAVQSDQTVR
jgi:hypothetical protein